MGMGMNYNKWLTRNLKQLTINYKSRNITSNLDEFCRYVYTGIINGCWLPVEYTYKIINS